MDKNQAKKYTKIAVTLGVIAAGSALLIGLANIITAGPIAQNELNKKLETIKVIYGENAKYSDETLISEEDKVTYPSLVSYFNAKDANDVELGNVFVTEGKNQYGAIKMAIGINKDATIGQISLIVNEQSFGPTLQSEYIDKLNKGDRDFDDVKCGATFGATLVNKMGKEALEYYKVEINGEAPSTPDVEPYLSAIFGEEATYSKATSIANDKYENLKEFYTAKDASNNDLGYVFVAEGKNSFGSVKISVGINTNGEIFKLYLIDNQQTMGGVDDYVDGFNKGDRPLDDTTCGATFGATLVKDLALEAQNYYKVEIKGGSSVVPGKEEYLTSIFGTSVKYGMETGVNFPDYPNVKAYHTTKNGAGNSVGFVFICEGSNDYGTIKMSVGITRDAKIGKIYLIENNQSFADKVNGYVDSYNNGSIVLDDVSCGATFGATLVKDMANQALAFAGAHLAITAQGE